ncbi:MAG: NAD(P)-dependent alcohol dehydrogenase [Desulfobacterales bacterium]|nr:NAD(P)-dependent alcohol dehydrogenase [Desulfobacterales bacterium]
MKALIYRKFGNSDVLEWVTNWPIPEPGANELLIRVFAGGINPKDVLLRKGKFSKTLARKSLPRVSGFDVAGEIVKIDKGTNRFKIGDFVFGMTNRFIGGVHAELVVLNENEIELKPENLTMIEAAAIPLAAQTALQALRDLGKVGNGSHVMINGASGGVGHFAVQIAKALGSIVVATCSKKNSEFVYSLGADKVIDYTKTSATEIQGQFDCVFDVFGQYNANDFLKLLSPKGVYVSTIPKFSTLRGEVMARLGISKRSRLVYVKSNCKDLSILSGWSTANKLKPNIDKVYKFEEASFAHKHIESKRTRGKIVFANETIL